MCEVDGTRREVDESTFRAAVALNTLEFNRAADAAANAALTQQTKLREALIELGVDPQVLSGGL